MQMASEIPLGKPWAPDQKICYDTALPWVVIPCDTISPTSPISEYSPMEEFGFRMMPEVFGEIKTKLTDLCANQHPYTSLVPCEELMY